MVLGEASSTHIGVLGVLPVAKMSAGPADRTENNAFPAMSALCISVVEAIGGGMAVTQVHRWAVPRIPLLKRFGGVSCSTACMHVLSLAGHARPVS